MNNFRAVGLKWMIWGTCKNFLTPRGTEGGLEGADFSFQFLYMYGF